MYDSIIIGTGPAGLSAALNLKTYKKDFIWFGSNNLSDKVQKAEKITNYPGFPQISGQELFERFDAHRRAAGIDITEKTVTNIMPAGNGFMVLADNEMYEARTLILCMGVMSAKQLDREDELLSLLRNSGYAAAGYKEIYASIYVNIIRSVALLDAIVILVAMLAGFFCLLHLVHVVSSCQDCQLAGQQIVSAIAFGNLNELALLALALNVLL